VSNKLKPIRKMDWLPYLIRGLMGIITAYTLYRELLHPTPSAVSNFPIYLGLYFLANGVITFKQVRMAPIVTRKAIMGSLTSIIGGLVILVTFPFSAYRATLVATTPGRIAFGTIVLLVGIVAITGKVRITPEPILRQGRYVTACLEVLLGVVIIIFPIDWKTRVAGIVWLLVVGVYMFMYLVLKLRGRGAALVHTNAS